MKIIKEGKPKVTEKKKSCGECKTKFAYEPNDVQQDRDGSYVNCPKCNAFISTN